MFDETIEVKRVDNRGDGVRKTIHVSTLEDGGKLIVIETQGIENFEDNPCHFYVGYYITDKNGKLIKEGWPIWGL